MTPVMAPGRGQNDAGNPRVSIPSSENSPAVGADVPFEELVARKLCASDEQSTDLSATSRGKAAKRPFLRKGARGWWMRKVGANQKVMKHTLVSFKDKEHDDKHERVQVSPQKSATRQSLASVSSLETLSPVATPPNHCQITPTLSLTGSPIGQSPFSYQANNDTDKCAQKSHEVAAWRRGSFRSTESTDTMGWKVLRHSYEANQEREADEMAEFEAIEQNLAAENEAYLPKKKQLASAQKDGRDGGYHSDDNQAERSHSSSDPCESNLSKWQTDGPDFLDNDGVNKRADAALVCDDDSTRSNEDWLIKSSKLTDQLRTHFGYDTLCRAVPSDLSAVSFDDSVPWDDDLSFQPRQSAAHEQHRNASINTDTTELRYNQQASFGDTVSAGTTQQAIKREVAFVDSGDESTDSFGCSIPGTLPVSKGGAPISSLVQQEFGKTLHDQCCTHDVTSDEGDRDSKEAIDDRNQENVASSSPPLPPFQDESLIMLKQKLHGKQNTSASRVLTGKRKGLIKGNPTARASPKQNLGARTRKATQHQSRASPVGSGMVLPAVIEDKLYELEDEVKFYKSETLQLRKRKDYYDQEVKKLSLERAKFAQYQHEQRLLIEKEWDKERVKMKKEEKIQARQWKVRMNATFSHQDRKNRREVETLKAQIVTMQLEAKARTSKLKAGNDTFRQRITELEQKNRELTEDIKFLEKDRLKQWEKYECLAKERHDASKLHLNCKTTPAKLGESSHLCTVDDVSVIKGMAEELLQKWSVPHEDELRGNCEEGDPTLTGHHRHEGKQLHEAAVYNPKRYSLGRKASELLTYENGFASTNDVNFSRETTSARFDHSVAITYEPGVGKDLALQNTSDGNMAGVLTSTLLEHKMVSHETSYAGGKKEVLFSDGSKKVTFSDGNEKEIDANGHVVIAFTNGDRKEMFPDTGISVYFYREAQTKLTTYPDNRKVYEFPNQQIETSLPDGTTEIQFADGIKKTIRSNGDEFSVFPDGTTMLEHPDGLREVTLLNKQRIRYYSDGLMTCVAPGGLETRVHSNLELKKLLSM